MIKTKIGESRYFYAPSSYNLAQGEFTVSQKELFFSTAAYGITPYWSVQLGSIIPLLFVDGAANVIVGTKLGYPITHLFGVQGGVQTLLINENDNLYMPFGGFTIGNPNNHLSLNYATICQNDYSNIHLFDFGFQFKLSERNSFLLELMLDHHNKTYTQYKFENGKEISTTKDTTINQLMALVGNRYHHDNFNMDLGFLFIENITIPIPWLDFSFYW